MDLRPTGDAIGAGILLAAVAGLIALPFIASNGEETKALADALRSGTIGITVKNLDGTETPVQDIPVETFVARMKAAQKTYRAVDGNDNDPIYFNFIIKDAQGKLLCTVPVTQKQVEAFLPTIKDTSIGGTGLTPLQLQEYQEHAEAYQENACKPINLTTPFYHIASSDTEATPQSQISYSKLEGIVGGIPSVGQRKG